MSNHNRPNGNIPNNGAATPADNGGKKEETKQTFVKKLMKTRDRIKANKAGKILLKVGKAIGVGGLAFLSYKAGARSVKPTTVYIREGVTEEEEPVKDQEPETEEEEIEE